LFRRKVPQPARRFAERCKLFKERVGFALFGKIRDGGERQGDMGVQ
jgi:hypothetical protein